MPHPAGGRQFAEQRYPRGCNGRKSVPFGTGAIEDKRANYGLQDKCPVTKVRSFKLNRDPTRVHSECSDSLCAMRNYKKAPPRRRETGLIRSALDLSDLLSLKALWALTDLELNKLTFVQRLVSIHFDGGEVNENILSRLTLNKPESLRCIKPLHHTLFSSQRDHSSACDVLILVLTIPAGGTRKPRATPGSYPHSESQDRLGGGIFAQTDFAVQNLRG